MHIAHWKGLFTILIFPNIIKIYGCNKLYASYTGLDLMSKLKKKHTYYVIKFKKTCDNIPDLRCAPYI